MKQPMTIIKALERRPGETDKAWAKRVAAYVAGEDVRSKDDMREWTGSPKFHLNKEA